MKIVGSERILFDNFKEEFEEPFQNFNFRKKYFFSSGRGALKNVAYYLKENEYRVLFPDYFCEEMLTPFLDENVDIKFYKIRNNLSSDTDSLKKEKSKKTAIFITDYFGFQDENLLKLSKEKGFLTVRDITHSLLSRFQFSSSDVVVGSLRKMFPVPDGGVLFTDLKNFKKFRKSSDEGYYIGKIVSKLYREIFENYGYEKDFFEKMYVYHSHKSEKEIGDIPKNISRFSLNFLKIYDIKRASQKRKENFNFLLNDDFVNEKAIFKNLPEDVVPQSFPIKIENRDFVKSEIQKYKIFLPILWRCQNKLSEKILNIPVDEEYSKKDLKRTIEKIKLVIGSKNEYK
ncbi:MAG: hypothetical protein ABIN00_03170 [candidate division WOR-3 bacterium]